jgi:hypothetical protein
MGRPSPQEPKRVMGEGLLPKKSYPNQEGDVIRQ